MAGQIGVGISHRGLYVEAFNFPWYLKSDIVAADVGKVVTADTTAAKTVKLSAAANAVLLGVLQTVEIRTGEGINVGTVAHKGGYRVPTTGTVNVGDTLVGSTTPGVAQAAGAANWAQNIVTEIHGDNTATVIFM